MFPTKGLKTLILEAGRFVVRSLWFVAGVFFLSMNFSCQKKQGLSAAEVKSKEIEISGTIKNEEPLSYVQSADSVEISGVRLAVSSSYILKAFVLSGDGSKKSIFSGEFAEPKFSFKAKVLPQYLTIEITRQADGASFGAVMPPVFKSRKASVVVDRTTSIAWQLINIIFNRINQGELKAKQAIEKGYLSLSDLVVMAQSVRRTVDEQKATSKGDAIDLTVLAINLLKKSMDRVDGLLAEGQAIESIVEKLSDAAYDTMFGFASEAASPGILAYRTNLDLGSSKSAKIDVAYEAIKASESGAVKPVDAAFRVESEAYRSAPSLLVAVVSESVVDDGFKTIFAGCMNVPATCAAGVFTPPEPPASGALALSQIKACNSNGEVGCITTAQYKAADLTNLAINNIKSGVSIAGVTGSLVNPDPWDLRVGRSVNGVGGKLKVNCKNTVNSLIFNFDTEGVFNSTVGPLFGQEPNNRGSKIDIWDTIDDSNQLVPGVPASFVPEFGANSSCGGVESVAGDDGVWRDVSVAGTGAASCNGSPENCTMQDKITGLWWSKLVLTASGWDNAWYTCLKMNHNGQAGWRLPTQKEMIEAYTHGIRSAVAGNWIPDAELHQFFWSGSTVSSDTTAAWSVFLALGAASPYNSKNTSQRVVCVR